MGNELLIAPEKAPIIKPQDGPQTAALLCEVDELLYGGGVFGGKTWELCIDALGLQYERSPLGKRAIDIERYRGVLFRRKTTEFTKLIEETHNYYPWLGGKFLLGRRGDPGPSWTFKSGARIFICHLESEDNKFDHDSMEYQFIGFDQLEQFTLTQYLHMLGRGRTLVAGLFVRYRSTANPIGPGLKWVRDRFVKDNEPYALRYMLPAEDPKKNPAGIDITQKVISGKATPQEMKDMTSRCYIPARYTDNPIGMERDPGYAGRVKMQGKKHEKALLNNDWEAFSGDFFDDFNGAPEDQGGMCVQPFGIPKSWRITGSLDPGWTSPFSFSLRAISPEGKVYRLGGYYRANGGMTENVDNVVRFIKSNQYTQGRIPDIISAGHDCWAKHNKLAIIGDELTYADMFEAKGITLTRSITDRVIGWGAWKDMMRRKLWFYFDVDTNMPLIDEILGAEHDELDPNDIKGRGNDPEVSDHALDEERYGIMAIYKPARQKESTTHTPPDYKGKKGKSFGNAWEPGMN